LKYYELYVKISIEALGGVMMDILRVIVTILYVIICIALVVVVLMQEGKSAGLSGSINGMADTYWGKNKGRSMEGALVKFTKYLAIGFIILSVILNLI
jgi:preprotein translocase subunit SecG